MNLKMHKQNTDPILLNTHKSPALAWIEECYVTSNMHSDITESLKEQLNPALCAFFQKKHT